MVGNCLLVMMTGLSVFVKVWTIVVVRGVVVVVSSSSWPCVVVGGDGGAESSGGTRGKWVVIIAGRVNVSSGIVVVGIVNCVEDISEGSRFFSGVAGLDGTIMVVGGVEDGGRTSDDGSGTSDEVRIGACEVGSAFGIEIRGEPVNFGNVVSVGIKAGCVGSCAGGSVITACEDVDGKSSTVELGRSAPSAVEVGAI